MNQAMASQVDEVMDNLKSFADAYTSLVRTVNDIRDDVKDTIETIWVKLIKDDVPGLKV